MVVGLWSTIFFAKAWTIGRYGSDVPNWDQWDAEGEYLLVPWKQDRLDWAMLVKPHNEHRVVLTKLLTLASVAVNGQWDARLQCVINAGLHATLAAIFFVWLQNHLVRWAAIVWALALVATHAPPLAWENVLIGFHSQQLFLVGSSLIAIERLLRCAPWESGWWLGAISALLALGSMGSGLFAATVVLLTLPFYLRAESDQTVTWQRALSRRWPTLLVALALLGAGIATRVEVDYHAILKARSWSDFLLTFFRAIQWPVTRWSAFAVINGLPWLLLVWRLLRHPKTVTAIDRVLVGAGLWVLLQFAATAYARGNGGQWPPSRYLDFVLIGTLVNIAVSLRWLSKPTVSRLTRGAGITLLALWLGILGFSLVGHLHERVSPELAAVHDELKRDELSVRRYLVSGEKTELKPDAIPYPSVDVLIERLTHPELRQLMPAGVRPALPLTPWKQTNAAPSEPAPTHEAHPSLRSWKTNAETGSSAAWQSEPLRSDSAYLLFWVRTSINRSGLVARIEPITPGGSTIDLIAATPSRPGWHPVYVSAPRSAFTVKLQTENGTSWVDVTDPVEVGQYSAWTWRLTQVSSSARWLGAALLCITICFWTPGNPCHARRC